MSEMSEYDRTHVGKAMREGDWFTAKLFRLIGGADLTNRERIRTAFPEEVAAFEAWLAFGDEEPPEGEGGMMRPRR